MFNMIIQRKLVVLFLREIVLKRREISRNLAKLGQFLARKGQPNPSKLSFLKLMQSVFL